MHDIKEIRNNPKDFDLQLKKRMINPLSSKILKIDKNRRKKIEIIETLKSSLNMLSKKCLLQGISIDILCALRSPDFCFLSFLLSVPKKTNIFIAFERFRQIKPLYL